MGGWLPDTHTYTHIHIRAHTPPFACSFTDSWLPAPHSLHAGSQPSASLPCSSPFIPLSPHCPLPLSLWRLQISATSPLLFLKTFFVHLYLFFPSLLNSFSLLLVSLCSFLLSALSSVVLSALSLPLLVSLHLSLSPVSTGHSSQRIVLYSVLLPVYSSQHWRQLWIHREDSERLWGVFKALLAGFLCLADWLAGPRIPLWEF